MFGVTSQPSGTVQRVPTGPSLFGHPMKRNIVISIDKRFDVDATLQRGRDALA